MKSAPSRLARTGQEHWNVEYICSGPVMRGDFSWMFQSNTCLGNGVDGVQVCHYQQGSKINYDYIVVLQSTFVTWYEILNYVEN